MYNKEEVMKEFEETFTFKSLSEKGKLVLRSHLSDALDAAFKAGEDARNMKIHKTIVDLPYPRDMYVARHRSEILAAIEALK